MVTLCYGQIAMIEASGAFFAYLVVMAENGFWPSRLVGLREAWESSSVNDLRDSYGQEWTFEQRYRFAIWVIQCAHIGCFSLLRHNLDLAAQTAYFIAIVITQIGNLYGNKTTRRSVFQQGIFGNRFMVFAVFFTFALACFLLYIPKLNRALNLAPNRFLWWLPAIPFFLYLFAFNEARKFFIRKYPNRFPARQLTYWSSHSRRLNLSIVYLLESCFVFFFLLSWCRVHVFVVLIRSYSSVNKCALNPRGHGFTKPVATSVAERKVNRSRRLASVGMTQSSTLVNSWSEIRFFLRIDMIG